MNQVKNSPMTEFSHRVIASLPAKLVLVLSLVVMALFAVSTPAYAVKPGWIVRCVFSHSLADDPIVFPGQPGASHLHEFVGARNTDAHSTVASLQAGGTTCEVPFDFSAYWVPALYEDGQHIPPRAAQFYYRRVGAPDGTDVQTIPSGLKMIIGNAHAQSPAENPQLGSDIVFRCTPSSSPNLDAPPTQCDSGVMVMSLRFPNCWDGVNLDSADHRSHMAYPVKDSCPASHPVALPRVESFFMYNVGSEPIGEITLDSGPYYTAHQDFFNAWHPEALQNLVDDCMNAGVNCGKNPDVSVSGPPDPPQDPTPTPEPMPTPEPTEEPMPTPDPTEEPMPTPEPTEEPMPTPDPTEEPMPTPDPTEEPMPTPEPTEEPMPTPEPTEVPDPDPAPDPGDDEEVCEDEEHEEPMAGNEPMPAEEPAQANEPMPADKPDPDPESDSTGQGNPVQVGLGAVYLPAIYN